MPIKDLICPEISILPRRSTTEIPPNFSEAPYLRSSIPHPKTDFRKNQIASRRIIPWAESTKRFFRNQDWHSDDFGSRNPVFQIFFLRKCATSIVERVHSDREYKHHLDSDMNIKWLLYPGSEAYRSDRECKHLLKSDMGTKC